MADVNTLADSQLRSLARKIPSEILANLGTAELRCRCDTAAGLLDDMSRSNDEYERSRLSREAERVLNAISLRAWLMGTQVLLDEVAKAKADGAGTAHTAALNELDRFVRDNPQPGLQDAAVAAEISGINSAVDKPRRWYEVWKVR
jgi:hypothetical protein